MPGFHIHISASTALGVVYGGAAFAAFDVPAPTAALATVLCSVSGMLPDLDSGPGRPMHESVCFAAAAVPMLLVDRFKHWGWDHESIILASALIYLLIRFGLGHLLKKFTVHRGIFHSLPVALIFADIGFLVCTTGDLNLRYYKAGAVIVGFMSHLVLDEIWSVDFRHHRLKSSFGTALKMWSDCRWATGVAYSIMFVTTLLVMNDPVWETATPGEERIHTIAHVIVDDIEAAEQRAQAMARKNEPAASQPPVNETLR